MDEASQARARNAGVPDPGEQRLLGFYDRLRSGVEAYLERRAGRLGRSAAQALLLVPDLFLLLARMFLDRRVPASSRALIGGALAYFLLPVDLAPEIAIGPIGFLDDLVVAATVLGHALGPGLEAYAERYWSGSVRLREVLTDITLAANQLLGVDLAKRVERVIERRILRKSAAA